MQNTIIDKSCSIYLDNAATTQVNHEIYESMIPYFEDDYGNPSGYSSFAAGANTAIENSKKGVSNFLHCSPTEIYFTSGGTESDNWALKGVAFANQDKGRHIITSKIEHPAVLRSCEWLEKMGFDVTYVSVNEEGIVDLQEIENAIRSDTILISIMFANNEIGTIQPIKEIGEIAKKYDILFHTDAVQAYGHVPIDINECNIDLLSASGHKVNAPKGIGILYVRDGAKIEPLIHGGGQENGKRSGTYNVPGIVGFGKATESAASTLMDRYNYETKLRDHMIVRLICEIPDCRLNGRLFKRLPNNINISISGVDGESMQIMLDKKGIYASISSACASRSSEPSHVLLAIGRSPETANNTLRFTLSEKTTLKEIDDTVDELKRIVEYLRSEKQS